MTDTIASLAQKLRSAEADLRRDAAEALARLGPDAAPAALALVRASADESEEVREAVTAALEEMGPPSHSDVTALADLLADHRADVGYWAATLLGRLEAGAANAVPALVAALSTSPSLPLCERAAWALGRIGRDAAAALGSLQQAAARTEPRLARLAQEAIDRVKVSK